MSKPAHPFQLIPIERIHESPTNPRRTFGDMTELTDSIRAQGVLQPVLVRPAKVAGQSAPADFELVFGHRRYRAAKAAGLDALPAIVRTMDDVAVLEAQLVENAARQDIHPIEEAEALHRLHTQHGHSVDELATKTGKSKATIYARLKLCALGPEGRQAMFDGKLDFSLGLLIARIPDPKLQAQATAEILEGDVDGNPLSYRAAHQIIQREYMLELKTAPFDPKDAQLLPSAGACVTCPKRTGAQPELFADVKSADVCTDTTCYRKKLDAHWERTRRAAEEQGRRVLNKQETDKVFPYHGGGHLAWNAPFFDLDQRCHEDPKNRTFRQILKKSDVPVEVVVARDPSGMPRELITKEGAAKAIKAADVGFEPERPVNTLSDQERERRKKHEKLRTISRIAMGKVVESASEKSPSREFWRLLANGMIGVSWHEVSTEVARRRGLISAGVKLRPEEALADAMKGMTEGALRALVLELLLTRDACPSHSDVLGKHLRDAMNLYGVDLRAITKSVDASEVAKKKGAAKSKAKESRARCLGHDHMEPGDICDGLPSKKGRCPSCTTRQAYIKQRKETAA